MLTSIYDMQMVGKETNFKTKLPDSFIGVLVTSLGKSGVRVINIHDEGKDVVISTSLCEVRMTGSFSVDGIKRKLRNEYYGFLNERFDQRVRLLKEKGYKYYREYTCFAKSEISARNGNGISNGSIMHQEDFLFNYNLE